MNYDILTKGRSHLHELAVHLQHDINFNKLISCWPKFKFKGVEKEKIESYFYIYFLHHFFSKYIDIEDFLLKFSCSKRPKSHKAIVDVNLAKFVIDKYEHTYLDHPTNSYFYQISQWEYEENLTGIKIPRLQKLKKLYTQNEITNIYQKSTKIIVPSLSSVASFPDEFKQKLEYIPFWFPQFSNVKINVQNTREKTICFIGIVCPSKGIHYLVDALNLISYEGTLHIFGSTANELYMQYILGKAKFKIIFHGHLAQQELFIDVKNMDLAVMPSVSEGLPLSYLQALSLGVPVIASEDSSLREIIGNENIYSTRDVEDIANKISFFFTAGVYSIKNKVEKYTIENYIKKWRELINE